MVPMPDDYPRLPQRRPALRSVPTTERYIAPVATVRPAPQPDESLAETLRKLWRRRKLIAAMTIALGGIAAMVAWSLPSYYSAQARVLVGVQSPRVLNAEAIITDASPDAERVQNEGYVLQSRTLAKMVIDKLKLADNPAFNPALRKPSFWARTFDLERILPTEVNDWLAGLRTKPTGSVTAQQLTELSTQLVAAQTAKAEAESRLNEAQEMRKTGLGRESVPEVLRSPLIASLKAQQADAERKAAEMAAMYGDRHPLLRSARAEAGSAASRVNAEIAKTVEALSRDARSADARYQALNENFEKLKGQMGTVNDDSIGLEALERDATVNRNLLEAMLNRAKQSIGSEEILQANAKLVSPAAPPEATAYPPKALIAFLGAVGGLLLGCAISLMR